MFRTEEFWDFLLNIQLDLEDVSITSELYRNKYMSKYKALKEFIKNNKEFKGNIETTNKSTVFNIDDFNVKEAFTTIKLNNGKFIYGYKHKTLDDFILESSKRFVYSINSSSIIDRIYSELSNVKVIENEWVNQEDYTNDFIF